MNRNTCIRPNSPIQLIWIWALTNNTIPKFGYVQLNLKLSMYDLSNIRYASFISQLLYFRHKESYFRQKELLVEILCTEREIEFWHRKCKEVKGDSFIFHPESNYSKITTNKNDLVKEEVSLSPKIYIFTICKSPHYSNQLMILPMQ